MRALVTILANIGGIIALVRLLWDIVQHILPAKAFLMDCYKTDNAKPRDLYFVHITLTNQSYRPVTIIDMRVSTEKHIGVYKVSRTKNFIVNKMYGDGSNASYSQSIFTTAMPVNLSPKSSSDLLFEIIDMDKGFEDLNYVTLITDRREKTIRLTKTNMKQVNLFQFR